MKKFLSAFVALIWAFAANADRYVIPPNHSIWSDTNYGAIIGNTGTDSLEIRPLELADGFYKFNYNGRTGYIRDQYVRYEGDPVAAVFFDSYGNSIWKKSYSWGNKSSFTIYYDEKGVPTASVHRDGAINSAVLYDEHGKYYATVALDPSGNIKMAHGAVQVKEPTDPGVPVKFDGATLALGKVDGKGHPTEIVMADGKKTAAVAYSYRTESPVDSEVYARFDAIRAQVADIDAENNDVMKNALGTAGLIVYTVITLLLLAYMITYVFAFDRLNRMWNKIAGRPFAPQKRLSSMLVRGIVPAILLFLPVSMSYHPQEMSVYSSMRQMSEASGYLALGLLLAAAWIWFDAAVLNKTVTTRVAVCRDLYGTITLGALLMLIYILVYIAVFIIAVLFICSIAFNTATGSSTGAAGSGDSDSDSGGGTPYTCSSCAYESVCTARGDIIGVNTTMHTCSNYVPRR